ncbi:MAG: hypothetical protein Q4C34_08485 [Bacteroidales bacterium]|nr:hypothetical protein [Bacteroidales bacterium]
MLVRSQPYSVTASAYLGRIAVALFWRLWWLPLIPVAVIAVGAAVDVRIALVGLMALFIIYPAVMTLAIIRYGMGADVAVRSTATAMVLDDSALTLLCGPDAAPVTIDAARIAEARIDARRWLVMRVGRRPDDIVLVPVEALDPQDLQGVLQRFVPDWQG